MRKLTGLMVGTFARNRTTDDVAHQVKKCSLLLTNRRQSQNMYFQQGLQPEQRPARCWDLHCSSGFLIFKRQPLNLWLGEFSLTGAPCHSNEKYWSRLLILWKSQWYPPLDCDFSLWVMPCNLTQWPSISTAGSAFPHDIYDVCWPSPLINSITIHQIIHPALHTMRDYFSSNSIVGNYKTNAIPDAILCNNCLIRYYKLHTRNVKKVCKERPRTYAKRGQVDNVRWERERANSIVNVLTG